MNAGYVMLQWEWKGELQKSAFPENFSASLTDTSNKVPLKSHPSTFHSTVTMLRTSKLGLQ